jgi:hypothetical protein
VRAVVVAAWKRRRGRSGEGNAVAAVMVVSQETMEETSEV